VKRERGGSVAVSLGKKGEPGEDAGGQRKSLPECVGDFLELVLLLAVLHIQASVLGRANNTVPDND
jgi:hypothetical protein